MPMRLNREALLTVVRTTPLVSIDLVVTNPNGEVLVGLRENEPARGFWFVPGGRIYKDEHLADAFARLTRDELGQALPFEQAKRLGVYEHLYDTNFAGEPGVTTHYVVLAHQVPVPAGFSPVADGQHREFRFLPPDRLRDDPQVHPNTQVYAAAL